MKETRPTKRTIEDILSPESAKEVRALHAICSSIKDFDPDKNARNARINSRLTDIRDALLEARHARLAKLRQEEALAAQEEAIHSSSKRTGFEIDFGSESLMEHGFAPAITAHNIGQSVVAWTNYPGPNVGVFGQATN